MTKISIIVPIYNAEPFLEKCLSSIFNQTYSNIEVILVNDGSTDNSFRLCNEIAKNDKRVKLINKPNGGVSSARNAGLDIATGEFIGFVDSDDYICPNMYEMLYKSLVLNEADLVECGVYRDKDGEVFIERDIKDKIIMGNEECIYHYLKKENTFDYNVNKLYRGEILKNIRFSKYKYSEDYLFNVKVMVSVKKMAFISEPLYYYVDNQDGAVNAPFTESKLDVIKAGEEAYNILLQYDLGNNKGIVNYSLVYILYRIIVLYRTLLDTDVIAKKSMEETLVLKFKEYYSKLNNGIIFKKVDFRYKLPIFLFSLNRNIYLLYFQMKRKLIKRLNF